MQKKPTTTISVILPTFNGERYLTETLESIASQKLPINQLVCSDNQSTDNTLSIIRAFSERVSFEVICLSQPAKGITNNYLNALSKANGDIVLVTDQDDVWLESKTQQMKDALNRKEVALVSHDSLLVDSDLTSSALTLRGNRDKSKRLSGLVNNGSSIANLELYLRGGIPLLAHTLGFKSELTQYLLDKPEEIDDWWFEEWVGFIALTQGRLFLLEEHLILYRQHDSQTSGGIQHSSSSRLKVTSGKAKYESRMRKLSYCIKLIQHTETNAYRADSLSRYLSFLEARQTGITHSTFSGACKGILTQLYKGNYTRYAKGIRSAALDMFTYLKG